MSDVAGSAAGGGAPGGAATGGQTSTPSAGAPSGGTPAARSAPGTGSPANNANPNPNAQGKAPAQPNPAGQTQAAAERILAEADLDAFIVQKVNGKEERIKVRDALKGYGLDKSAQQKMQEAAQVRKNFQDMMGLFENDFDQFCKRTGFDGETWLRAQMGKKKAIAEDIIAHEFELQNMTPEQRKAYENEQRLKTFEGREVTAKKPLIDAIKKIVPENQLPQGFENATKEQLEQYYKVKNAEFTAGVDNISNELLGAWEKVGLPKEKDFGIWMAQDMLNYKNRTGQDLHPEQAAARIKDRFLGMTKAIFNKMESKSLLEALGPEVVQKIKDFEIQRATGQAPQNHFPNGPGQNSPASPAPKKQMNQFEWRKWANGEG